MKRKNIQIGFTEKEKEDQEFVRRMIENQERQKKKEKNKYKGVI